MAMTGDEQIKVMRSLTQKSAGWLVGLRPRTLRDDTTVPRSEDGMYDASELVAWKVDKAAPAPVPAAEGDDLLNGGDSPALERYRMARAELAEMDAEHRRGELLEAERVREQYGVVAAVLRQMGQTLQKKFGPEAHEIVEEAWEDAERLIKELINDDNGGR